MPDLEDLPRGELIELVRVQAAELDQLRAELERLKRLVSRNSGNSSMPPSTDDLAGRTKPARREKTAAGNKRKRGKQPGAAGKNLPWLADAEAVDHRPAGVCPCGADLAEATDEGVDRVFQVTDVPLVTVTTTEHRMHRTRCACGRHHVAAPPTGASTANTRVYGPNLRTLVVYLVVFQHVPVHRCAQLIADLTGAAPSVGFVHGMLARCAAALSEVTTLIKTLITMAAVAHFDETTLRVGPAGVKKYVWSASTNRYTVFALGRRSGAQFRTFAVGTRFAGVAVHDRYAVYDTAANFAPGVRHQICCSHILRDLTDAAESYPDAVWPIQCARALRGLIHAANLAREAGCSHIAPKLRTELIGEFRNGVLVGLKDIPHLGGPADKQLPARSLLEVLRDRHDDITRFCYDTTIPATNNLAERRFSAWCSNRWRACTTPAPRATSWPGSAPMWTAWTTCRGCDGRTGSSSRRARASEGGWRLGDGRFMCSDCGARTSVTAGTIFDRTRTPLTVWFHACWMFATQKDGVSAQSLQRVLEIGSYQTAWAMLHRLREALVRPGRDRLTGEVEMDELFVGGEEPGLRGGRAKGKKVLVGCAVERKYPKGFGRVRMAVLPDASTPSLCRLPRSTTSSPAPAVITDGCRPTRASTSDYYHLPIVGDSLAVARRPPSHRAIKRWLLSTHQGSVDPAHLPGYLNEFVFRFNRRASADTAACSSCERWISQLPITPCVTATWHRTGGQPRKRMPSAAPAGRSSDQCGTRDCQPALASTSLTCGTPVRASADRSASLEILSQVSSWHATTISVRRASSRSSIKPVAIPRTNSFAFRLSFNVATAQLCPCCCDERVDLVEGENQGSDERE